MLKNPNYLYGKKEVFVPGNLNFGDFILSQFWEQKERIAIINGETQEEATFKQVSQEAMSLAISLVRIGVRKGDVVAICSENRQEFWSTALGVVCTGAVVTTINMGYSRGRSCARILSNPGDLCTLNEAASQSSVKLKTEDGAVARDWVGELKHAISMSKPKYVFCSPVAYKNHAKSFGQNHMKIIYFGDDIPKGCLAYNDLAKGFIDGSGERKDVEYEEFQPIDVDGQDTAFLMYSSGTTGMPKAVMLSHLNMLAAAGQPDNRNVDQSVLVITPWYHVMGLGGGFTYLAAGRTVVYLPRFEPGMYLKTIEKYKVTQITVAPPVLVALTKFPSVHDVSSVTIILSSSAPLRSDTISDVCARFPNASTVYQGYGMTETTLSLCKSFVGLKPKVGSVGMVLKGTVIKIVDIETRKPLGRYQEGEICVKGSLVMKGYVGKDRREDFDDEGFFRTGDIGYYDEEEYLFVVGRLKELIKYKGYQVPPAEIEAILLQHQSIRDAGVIGIPDDDAGEVPRAFVVLQPGVNLTEKEVKEFVAEKLSNPKHLRGGVQFVSQIPKTASGKILRNQLRQMLEVHKSKL